MMASYCRGDDDLLEQANRDRSHPHIKTCTGLLKQVKLRLQRPAAT